MRGLINLITPVTAVLLTAGLASAGTITGEAKFVGEVPKVEILKADADDFCIKEFGSRPSEKLIVSKEKGIKNVVVSVEGIEGEFDPPEENPVLDQVNCIYVPHVMAVLAGTVVDVHTSDPANHNVRSNAEENEAINWAMPEQDMTLPYELTEPEIIRLTCDIHKWMSAYIVVKENPYFAISDDKGIFKITGVPAGKYKLQAWHEELGTQTQEVNVPEVGEAKITFNFSLRKEEKGK